MAHPAAKTGIQTGPKMSFERLLEFVSRHDTPFLFLPAVLLVLVEISHKLGPFGLQQALDFLTFRK